MKLVQWFWGTLVTVACTTCAQAQTPDAGLYITANDFQQQKITYAVNCSNGKDKLKVNSLFDASTGYVVVNGEKHAFNKKQVYGYRTCKNNNFRLYNNTPYQVINTTGFFIYYRSIQTEAAKGKGLVKADAYFFSTQADSTIQPLTVDNLKKAYPGNHEFQYALDANFRSDKDLTAWDTYQKTYKVQYLYSLSLK